MLKQMAVIDVKSRRSRGRVLDYLIQRTSRVSEDVSSPMIATRASEFEHQNVRVAWIHGSMKRPWGCGEEKAEKTTDWASVRLTPLARNFL